MNAQRMVGRDRRGQTLVGLTAKMAVLRQNYSSNVSVNVE
jgi:hypothetical protein